MVTRQYFDVRKTFQIQTRQIYKWGLVFMHTVELLLPEKV